MGTPSALHQSNWRQGTIIPHELVDSSALPTGVGLDARLIVVSHDCDLVHPSYDTEPYVEFVIARPRAVTARDGRFFHGKNPRRLQLWLSIEGEQQLFEISAHEKHRMSKNMLERGRPDARCSLSAAGVQTLARWLSKRYYRPAFPSEFNRRINPVAKNIEKSMAANGEDVSSIFIAFLGSDSELPSSQSYKVIIRVVIPAAAAADDQLEQRALKLVTDLEKYLSQCAGVEVAEVKLDTEAEFTLQDLKESRLWDYEFLSAPEEGV